jgi:hypothetical protein
VKARVLRSRAARGLLCGAMAVTVVTTTATAQVGVSTPEEEGVLDTVFIPDPGPIFLIDPGVIDQIVVGNAGELPNDWPHIQYLFYVLSTLTNGNCDNGASATVPVKEGAKIKARGAMTCPTIQKEISLKVCIDYRQGGEWILKGCKPKTVTDTASAHKRITVTCEPGRFLYRTRVVATATNQNNDESFDTATATTQGRIPCAV